MVIAIIALIFKQHLLVIIAKYPAVFCKDVQKAMQSNVPLEYYIRNEYEDLVCVYKVRAEVINAIWNLDIITVISPEMGS